ARGKNNSRSVCRHSQTMQPAVCQCFFVGPQNPVCSAVDACEDAAETSLVGGGCVKHRAGSSDLREGMLRKSCVHRVKCFTGIGAFLHPSVFCRQVQRVRVNGIEDHPIHLLSC